MRAAPLVLTLAVVASLLALVPLAPPAGAAAGPSAGSGTTPITGNVSGPSLLPTSSNGTFYLNATGGPAVISGQFLGTINWTANLTGANTTGDSVKPSNGTITNSTTLPVKLLVTTGPVLESLTLTVKVTSTVGPSNKTANFSTTFRLVVPYTLRATVSASANVAILPFNVTVALDGKVVGTVAVPKLSPNESYGIVYRYPSGGLPSGNHTFTLSVADEHGLVTFANGQTVQSTTFYVAGAAPNYTVWYVTGIVAFFGVLFIYATRVAARRRGPARR